MQTDPRFINALLESIVEHIDIPRSYYEKASARHKSIGEWLCRPASKVAEYKPDVALQGSFRYGTVNRPLLDDEEYDLDNATCLKMAKTAMSQKRLKHLLGDEIKLYAQAHDMNAPVEEKDRCWRLVYADEVNFHLDALPCIPEDLATIRAIIDRGVPSQLAELAVAITDRRHKLYEQNTSDLLCSNPRGFALWFVQRCRAAAQLRLKLLVEQRLYATVEDVPPYEWKTPLQRSIQILKRHRDVMFRDDRDSAPISMIITNLAAHAYFGETDLWSAVKGIVERMPNYILPKTPRIPNPAAPAEDYADKWAKNPALEDNFWSWHTQVKTDLTRLPAVLGETRLAREVRGAFRVNLTEDELRSFAPPSSSGPAIIRSAPVVAVSSPPRPWGHS